MKKSIIPLFLVLTIFPGTLKNDPFVHSNLDRTLISLWNAAEEENSPLCKEYSEDVKIQLKSIHKILEQNNTVHFDKKQFVKYTNTVHKVMARYVLKDDFVRIKFFVVDLLYENYALRQCLSDSEYPIDYLLQLSEAYSNVHRTVDDPMMDLLEWNEFMGLVEELIEKWEAYNCLSIDLVHQYFPDVSEQYHQELKDNANDCLEDFIISLQSGFRSDFQLPCDDMGEAFSGLFKIYSYENRYTTQVQ